MGTKVGHVTIHRQIMDHIVWKDPYAYQIWNWCLFKAAFMVHYRKFNGTEVKLKRGQFIYGRNFSAKELPISHNTIRKWMDKFENDPEYDLITRERKQWYSIITVKNYTKWQRRNQL